MSSDHEFSLKREFFGQKINFKAKESNSSEIFFKENPMSETKYVHKNPKTITLGNCVEKSSHSIHTEKTKTKLHMIRHVEGAWPETIDGSGDTRGVATWKRTKEKGDEFPEKIRKLIGQTESILKQNLRMDVYEEYFENIKNKGTKDVSEDDFAADIRTVFKDVCLQKRSVAKISICPDPETPHRIAIAYKLKENEQQGEIDKSKLPCLVWDIKNPNQPTHQLYSTTNSEIVTCAFNNRYPNILGAGLSNGGVLIFDLNTNKVMVAAKLEHCHSEAVRDFVWLKSKTASEFVTTSTDGKVIWWDIRDLQNPKKIYMCPDGAERLDPKAEGDPVWEKIQITKYLF